MTTYAPWLTLREHGSWELTQKMVEGNKVWADYAMFQITGENFQLHVDLYNTNSTAGDSLTYIHNRMMFTTKDKDNDNMEYGNSAEQCIGAWWYDLNGVSWQYAMGYMEVWDYKMWHKNSPFFVESWQN